jgi:DNA-binding transcriptional MerR regulator
MQLGILHEYTPPGELASELGVCVKTLERWRTLGHGPPVTKIGRRVYYRKSSVIDWLVSRERSK